MYYKEAKNGQILEEGINEAGAMSSFMAAGTAYSNLGIHMIPFYVYYSMFGFQRVGDLIWLAADARARGFLIGGTSGRTTLNGEGLQHQDGHSLLIASSVPTVRAYDPAFAYEVTVIIQDGLRRMCQENEDGFYYISVYNENYAMPEMPAGCEEGILKGIYKLPCKTATSNGRTGKKNAPRPQLFGSGPLLNEACRAQTILADRFGINCDVWSVTSYNELFRDARLRTGESPACEGKAAEELPGTGPGRPFGPLHFCQRQRATRGRSNSTVGAGALRYAGDRRFRTQRYAYGAAAALRDRRGAYRVRRFECVV